MARLEPFWRVACDYRHLIWLGVMISMFFVILGVLSIAFAPPESPSFAIAAIDLVLSLSMIGVSLSMFYVCQQRRDKQY